MLNPRLRNSWSGSMGSGARSSEAMKAARSRPPATMGGSTVRLVQPWTLPRTTPKTMPSSPRLARTRPGRSSRLAAFGEAGPGDRQQRDADGHVQPEDPLPGRAFDHGPADQWPDGDGQATHRAPGAERHA